MNYVKTVLFFIAFHFLSGLAGNCQKKGLLNGTIIITLTSQDTIWIGADSRTSTLNDKGYTVNEKGMCKIYNTNDVVYAMAGHVRYVDNSFNFLEIMQKCVIEQKDFDKSMDLFQQNAKAQIASILKKFSRKSINTLVKTNNGSFLTVVAISFANGERKMKEMKFSIEANNSSKWNVVYKIIDDSGVGTLRFVGHAATASDYVKNNNLFFGNGRDIPGKINDLIKLEADSTVTVGMPADVISIYNGGFKRVISSGLCSE
ncbi:MAG: hypothetical protein M3040_15575 [Bacteroidota bacterium]|nr:hypothetical protein [Bacteroidota bacterium]